MRVRNIKVLSIAVLFQSAICFSVFAQVPPGHICERISGQPHAYQGSGNCAGNLNISVDLSDVYEGMSLNYNSTFGPADQLGFGKNWSLSEVPILNLKQQSIRYGDGTLVSLEKRSYGSLQGSLLPKERESSDYFTVETDRVIHSKMDGTDSIYEKVGTSDVYLFRKVTDRLGRTTEVSISGSTAKDEFIQYSDGTRITVRRTGKNISITRDKNHWANLATDAYGRLVKIRLGLGDGKNFDYEFTYRDKTHFITSYTFTSPDSKSSVKFLYDSKDRLIYQLSTEGYASRIVRYFDTNGEGVVKAITPDGIVHVERFNSDGRIVYSGKHANGGESDHSKYFDEQSYKYKKRKDGTIFLSSQGAPDGSITTHNYSEADPTLAVGYQKTSKDGKLTEKAKWAPSIHSRIPTLDKLTQVIGGKEAVVQNITIASTSARPFLPATVWNKLTGEYVKYAYDGSLTTVTRFNRNETKVAADIVRLDGQPEKTVNSIAPPSLQTTTFVYDEEGRLKKRTRALITTELGYDKDDQVNNTKNALGVETWATFDTEGEIATQRVRYPTGVESSTSTTRTKHADGSLATMEVASKYPNNLIEKELLKFADEGGKGKLLERWVNGVKSWENK